MRRLLYSLAACLALVVSPVFGQKVMLLGSSSMLPTFKKTDSIYINVLAYLTSKPARWDVITYLHPTNGQFWTHRVVGLPGDVVSYDDKKRLQINGIEVQLTPVDAPQDGTSGSHAQVFTESYGDERHLVQIEAGRPAFVRIGEEPFAFRTLCDYRNGGLRCKVPRAHYFVMGDNRDNAMDSRYLGFVPEERIGGRVEGVR